MKQDVSMQMTSWDGQSIRYWDVLYKQYAVILHKKESKAYM